MLHHMLIIVIWRIVLHCSSPITNQLCTAVSGRTHAGRVRRETLLTSQMSTSPSSHNLICSFLALGDIQSAGGHSTHLCFSPFKYPLIQVQVEPRRVAETPSTADLSSIIKKSPCRRCQVCLEHNLCLKQTLPNTSHPKRK
jgi:hypothetical protein